MEKKTYLQPAIYLHEYKPANLLAGSLEVFDEEADGSKVYLPDLNDNRLLDLNDDF